MRYLLKKVKETIASAVSALTNRISMGVIGEKTLLAGGPYCRVVFVGQEDTDYGFQDNVGYDETTLQFSVFAETLSAADTLVDGIVTAFHNAALTLDVGGKAFGRKLKRGILIEPKSADSNQVYHVWVTILFGHEDKLS